MKVMIQSVLILMVFVLLTGVIYPLVITGIAQLFFHSQANGSMVQSGGKTAGSLLIAQNFTNDAYFQPRYSAINYDGGNSGAYNSGPTSSNLMLLVSNRIAGIRKKNSLKIGTQIPADMVLASASGLDPDISISNAVIQSGRISKIRNIPEGDLLALISRLKDPVVFGFWGVEKVNVLLLNIELDKLRKRVTNHG